MRIFVVSDTHGNLKNAIKLYDMALKNGPVDCIIHCGDYQSDGIRLARVLGQVAYAVHGNCDGGRGEEFATVETPAGKILVIHGHNEGVNYSLDGAAALARREGCSMACYGHTHIAAIEEHCGILILNPGSAVRPLGTEGPSAAVLTADEDGFRASILYI
ncbi:MAG: metallophosphoesterase [Bacillota bacterium]